MKKKYTLLLLMLTIFSVSCSDNDGNNPQPLELASVYVINEGNFSDSNGSLTSYYPETQEFTTKAFEAVNGRPFAGVIQDSDIYGDKLYLAANVADKIEVINRKTLKSVETIEMDASPTTIEVLDEETAYVGMLDGNMRIIDLATGETTTTIEGFNGPRDIERVGDKIYVTNNYGSTISVIDANTNEFTNTIEVLPGPNDMTVDSENRIWLVCNGNFSEAKAGVYVIDGEQGTVEASITEGIVTGDSGYTKRMTLDEANARAFLINEGVLEIDMNTYEVTEKIIDAGNFKAIGYFPLQDRLYLGRNNGYAQTGIANVYTMDGTPIDTFNVGVAPRDIYFINQN
ncbi:MAG TPA: DUF5074 domain-containing protein [Fodinibius sp.]|nr:DUF5074 domain-containing protein [Fodinibius sp.]